MENGVGKVGIETVPGTGQGPRIGGIALLLRMVTKLVGYCGVIAIQLFLS